MQKCVHVSLSLTRRRVPPRCKQRHQQPTNMDGVIRFIGATIVKSKRDGGGSSSSSFASTTAAASTAARKRYRSSSSSSSSTSSSSSVSVGAAKKAKQTTQTYLDVGQRGFGYTSCTVCGMMHVLLYTLLCSLFSVLSAF